MGNKWIDISTPLRSGMVHWPGDPCVEITWAESIEKGDTANLSYLSMGEHSGTHIDAPLHFIPGGASIDTIPLSALIGPARVIGIEDQHSITVEELQKYSIQAGERILFKTRNSSLWEENTFQENFVYLTLPGAEYLVERGVVIVGIDYLSIGGYHKDGAEVHHTLLEHKIWIIEGLNLLKVEPGEYDLICLPLRLEGAEAAPARALLRKCQSIRVS